MESVSNNKENTIINKVLTHKMNERFDFKIEKILEILYMAVLTIWLGILFLKTTTFDMSWSDSYYMLLRLVLIGLIIIRACYCKTYSIWELIIVFILYVSFSFSMSRSGEKELLDILLVIVGAKDISFKKLLKVYVSTLGVLLLFTIAMALTGRIENLIFYQAGRRPRMAFGIIYPTDFSAYVFYILLAYFYIRGKRIKYIEIGAIILISMLIYWFCDARLNTICILIMVGVFLYNKVIQAHYEKKQKTYTMNKIWQQILTMSTSIAAIFMVFVTILYSIDNKVLVFLNKLLNNRLLYGNMGYDIYGLSFWGQEIVQYGAGGSTKSIEHYFFLDVSYVSILLRFGVIILGLVLVIWLLIGLKAQKVRKWELLWAIALIALQCTVEHHMLQVVYSPFLWALLANIESRKE